jgi:hypothetical protein
LDIFRWIVDIALIVVVLLYDDKSHDKCIVLTEILFREITDFETEISGSSFNDVSYNYLEGVGTPVFS